jgi:putative membrane protein
LRTALALVAGGVAMTQFAPDLGVPTGGPVVSIGLLLAGLLARGAAIHGRLLLVVPAAVVAELAVRG